MAHKQTLLVTGGAGFIGSSFVAQRIEAGDNVIVLDAFTYAGHQANLNWISNANNQLNVVKGNICDSELVLSLLKKHQVSALYSFAAESHVDNSISSPGAFIETNVFGVYSLLEAARAYWNALKGSEKEQFRFIQVSTDEVYGSLEADDPAFCETTPMQPNSPYSASKAAGDHLARAWFHTYQLPTIVTNCSNNYGPRQHPEKLIPTIITTALKLKPLPIYGDGQNIRDWIHVEDHSRGVWLAGQDGRTGETYCFGGNAERTNLQTVDAICTALDDLRPRADGKSYIELKSFVKDRAGHDRRYAINDAKACDELQFKRQYAFESGIQKTVAWYLENEAWLEAVRAHSAQEKAA